MEKSEELIIVCVFKDGSRDGITVCSSKMESRSVVLIPGMDDSAAS
jgi:hypothetical protein